VSLAPFARQRRQAPRQGRRQTGVVVAIAAASVAGEMDRPGAGPHVDEGLPDGDSTPTPQSSGLVKRISFLEL
jgi:hypothetical protein